jgi:hypothetical protein
MRLLQAGVVDDKPNWSWVTEGAPLEGKMTT